MSEKASQREIKNLAVIFGKNLQKIEKGFIRVLNFPEDSTQFKNMLEGFLTLQKFKVNQISVDPNSSGSGKYVTYIGVIENKIYYFVNVVGKKSTTGEIEINIKEFSPDKLLGKGVEVSGKQAYEKTKAYLTNNTDKKKQELLLGLLELTVQAGKNKQTSIELPDNLKKIVTGLENIITSTSDYGEILAMIWDTVYNKTTAVVPSTSNAALFDYEIKLNNKLVGRSVKGNLSSGTSITSLPGFSKSGDSANKEVKVAQQIFKIIGDTSKPVRESLLAASLVIPSVQADFINKKIKSVSLTSLATYVSSFKTFKDFMVKNAVLYTDKVGLPADGAYALGLTKTKPTKQTGLATFKSKQPENLIVYPLAVALFKQLKENPKFREIPLSFIKNSEGSILKISLKAGLLSFKLVDFKNLTSDQIELDYHARIAEPGNNRPGFKINI